MTKEYAPEEIKYRLSNIDDVIGNIALDYITKLEKENAELKERFSKKFDDEWRLNDLYQRLKIDFANAHKCSNIYLAKYLEAKEIIDHLLNFESMAQERGMCISDELRNKANEFLEADE